MDGGSTRELFNCAGNPSLLPFLIRMAEPFFHSATPELLQLLTPESISQFEPHGRRECLTVRRRRQFRDFLARFSNRIIHHRVPGTFHDVEFGHRSIRFHLEFDDDRQHFAKRHLAGRLIPGRLKSICQHPNVSHQCRISQPAPLGLSWPFPGFTVGMRSRSVGRLLVRLFALAFSGLCLLRAWPGRSIWF